VRCLRAGERSGRSLGDRHGHQKPPSTIII
jgi:hypothetical protein